MAGDAVAGDAVAARGASRQTTSIGDTLFMGSLMCAETPVLDLVSASTRPSWTRRTHHRSDDGVFAAGEPRVKRAAMLSVRKLFGSARISSKISAIVRTRWPATFPSFSSAWAPTRTSAIATNCCAAAVRTVFSWSLITRLARGRRRLRVGSWPSARAQSPIFRT